MKGFGQLDRPAHLLEKLRHDLARITSDPSDQYAAFDFFVTAEHMVDWVLPGFAQKQAQAGLRDSNPLLQVVSHIANGSKHFVAEARHHRHVQHVDAPPSAFQPSAFQSSAFQTGALYVTLEGTAAQAFGPQLEVTDLAERVFRFWQAYVEAHP
jgi:hypothetical protein